MMLNNLRDNIQAHPESQKGTLLERDRPGESFKDLPSHLPWNPNPLIAHTDRDRLGLGGERHVDQRSVWSIFDGIAEHIQEDLCESITISDHESEGCSRMDHNGMSHVHVLNHVNHFLKHCIQIDRLVRIFQLPGLDA